MASRVHGGASFSLQANFSSPRIIFLAALFSASLAGAQNFTDLKIDKIATGLQFAEGPSWSKEGFLLFSDCVSNKLHKFVPGTGLSDLAEIPGGPNGNTYDAQAASTHVNSVPAASLGRIKKEPSKC
jgi:hypothetical protein